jgi:hypothetical protein
MLIIAEKYGCPVSKSKRTGAPRRPDTTAQDSYHLFFFAIPNLESTV